MTEKDLIAVAVFLCGCKADDLLKVRGDGAGGLVAIVASGAKRVFTAEQVTEARKEIAEATTSVVAKPSEVIVPGKPTAQLRAEVRKLLMSDHQGDDLGHEGVPEKPKPKPKAA